MTVDLRYPVGEYTPLADADAATYARLIDEIERLPNELRAAVAGLSDAQLDTPYRDGGWTVRQVVHHVPDSHLNAYVRFKLALTEDAPRIKPYEESRWAELADARMGPEVSLALLDALHERWVVLLRSLAPADLFLTRAMPTNAWRSRRSVLGSPRRARTSSCWST